MNNSFVEKLFNWYVCVALVLAFLIGWTLSYVGGYQNGYQKGCIDALKTDQTTLAELADIAKRCEEL